MTIFQSPQFLRNVLLADAATCLATGALQLALLDTLAGWLQLPRYLLAATGAFLLLYAAAVAFAGTRRPVPRGWVAFFAAGNLGWALACGALLASGWIAPSTWGVAWIAAQAVTVVVLAELQWMGLRHTARTAFA